MLQCQHSPTCFLTSIIFTSNLINTGFKSLPSPYFYDFFSLIAYSHLSRQGLPWAQQYLPAYSSKAISVLWYLVNWYKLFRLSDK